MRTHSLHRLRRDVGMTLTELATASAIGMMVVLIGWVTVEMSHRETASTLSRTESSRTLFGAIKTIEDDILRSQTIEVPDPDYPDHNSIQLHIPLESGTVRRAYRLDGTTLIAPFALTNLQLLWRRGFNGGAAVTPVIWRALRGRFDQGQRQR